MLSLPFAPSLSLLQCGSLLELLNPGFLEAYDAEIFVACTFVTSLSSLARGRALWRRFQKCFLLRLHCGGKCNAKDCEKDGIICLLESKPLELVI